MDGSTWVVRWLPGVERTIAAHRAAGQQLDDLCAVHQAAILLRSDDVSIDTEDLALEAGSALPRDARASAPPGVPPRRDYRRTLPVASDGSGTAVSGLIEAVAIRSDGRRALVPLHTRWTGDRVLTLLELCRDRSGWEAVPIANLRTGRLWGSRLSLVDATTWLGGGTIDVPTPDWDVGHFVTLVGTVEGDSRALVVVRDSYPTFGWDGHHLQPPEAVASALERGDGREGGVALYVRSNDRDDVERAAKDAGFDIAVWDNGTPWPPDRDEGGTDR